MQSMAFCFHLLNYMYNTLFVFIDSPLKGLGTGMVLGSKDYGSRNTCLGKAAVFTAPSMELR